jgi:hypothetical protein
MCDHDHVGDGVDGLALSGENMAWIVASTCSRASRSSPAGRLIEQQDVRLTDQRPRDERPHALAAAHPGIGLIAQRPKTDAIEPQLSARLIIWSGRIEQADRAKQAGEDDPQRREVRIHIERPAA